MTTEEPTAHSGAQPQSGPKPKPGRPRDELGRPLPKGSVNRLHLEDFDALSLEENHRLAIHHFEEGQFFEAHEAWETCWNQARGTTDEDFFKGLAQLGAGYAHYRRGNARGATALMRRGLGRIASHAPRHRGLDVLAFVAAASKDAVAIQTAAEAATALPSIAIPALRVNRIPADR